MQKYNFIPRFARSYVQNIRNTLSSRARGCCRTPTMSLIKQCRDPTLREFCNILEGGPCTQKKRADLSTKSALHGIYPDVIRT